MIDTRGSPALDRHRLRWPELAPIFVVAAAYFALPDDLVFGASAILLVEQPSTSPWTSPTAISRRIAAASRLRARFPSCGSAARTCRF